MRVWRSVVVLSGGIGGARLVDGLAQVLPSEALTVVVNTGDDFTHWGLAICPDLDTVMYTLSGLAAQERGWGLEGETFAALHMMARYGGEDWFSLGDRDLATHLLRTQLLAAGQSLTEITATLCGALDVQVRVLPMADEPRQTMIDTAEQRTLNFQHWLVRDRAQAAVERVWFSGSSVPSTAVLAALKAAEVVVIAPSNPYVSIDPIMTLDGVRDCLAEKPLIAVSPIVAGHAVKGPLAAMIPALAGRSASAAAVAAHYGDILNAYVVEHSDVSETKAALAAEAGEIEVWGRNTVMHDRAARVRLAQEVMALGAQLVDNAAGANNGQ